MSDQTQDVSRRDLLRNIGAITLTTFGVNVVTAEGAQHVHNAVNDARKTAQGPYKPKCFTAEEYTTLQRLADLSKPFGTKFEIKGDTAEIKIKSGT